MSLPRTVELLLAMRKLLFLLTKTQADGVRTVCGTKHLKNSAEIQVYKKIWQRIELPVLGT